MTEPTRERRSDADRADAAPALAPQADAAAPSVAEAPGGPRAQRGLAPDPTTQRASNQASVLSGGSAGPLPFQAEMEASFGVSLSKVKATYGDPALGQLGAQAANEADVIAFRSASPTKEEVAEEVAHWVQRQKSGAAQASQASQAVDGGKSDPAERDAQQAAATAAAGGQAEVKEAPTAQVHRAADDPVNLAETTDVSHPWLVASGIADLGPYAFMPAQTKFILKPSAAFKTDNDKANAWAALLDTTSYTPETATWTPRQDLQGKPTLEKDGKFTLGAPIAKQVESRTKTARSWVSPNNLKWATAMISHQSGNAPKLAAITDHEGVGGEGHTIDRHVMVTGSVKSERDLARRAAFNYLFPALGKATAFKNTAAADTAAGLIHAQMSGGWLQLRNTILDLKDKVGGAGHELLAAAPANYVAYAREAGVQDTDPQPAYLGLGAGVRPLFPADVQSQEWTTWAAQNQATAQPNSPLTKPFAPSKTTAFVRPTDSAVTGGWFFKTVYPDG